MCCWDAGPLFRETTTTGRSASGYFPGSRGTRGSGCCCTRQTTEPLLTTAGGGQLEPEDGDVTREPGKERANGRQRPSKSFVPSHHQLLLLLTASRNSLRRRRHRDTYRHLYDSMNARLAILSLLLITSPAFLRSQESEAAIDAEVTVAPEEPLVTTNETSGEASDASPTTRASGSSKVECDMRSYNESGEHEVRANVTHFIHLFIWGGSSRCPSSGHI